MTRKLGERVLHRLQLGSPWRSWRLARQMGLDAVQSFTLFEEARRANDANDWRFQMAGLLAVLMAVAASGISGSGLLVQFSAPAGFLGWFLLLLLRTSYHHHQALLRHQTHR
ncbi:MAG: hypothetical protein HYV26_12105 [Candidatus Hydrogenedentes bacterium]|nr:hypothetical protein [Candidatus Hydrogenedentota bacterium]